MIKIDISKADQAKDMDYSKPIPQGWHNFIIQEVNIKQGNSGDYIELVLFCNAQKRKVWDNHFPNSDKPYCHKRLKDLLTVCDIPTNQDTFEFDENEFLGSTFKGRIKNESKKVNGEQKINSSVVEYKHINDSSVKTVSGAVSDESFEDTDEEGNPIPF